MQRCHLIELTKAPDPRLAADVEDPEGDDEIRAKSGSHGNPRATLAHVAGIYGSRRAFYKQHWYRASTKRESIARVLKEHCQWLLQSVSVFDLSARHPTPQLERPESAGCEDLRLIDN